MSSLKDQFPFLSLHKELIYFDSAATTHKPSVFINALHSFYAKEYATVHRTIYKSSLLASEKYHNTRCLVKSLINARQDSEVIFTKGTTDSLNLVALSLGPTVLQEGDEIVLSQFEHHSNLVPWQMLAEKTKAKLKFFPACEGVLDISNTITSKTKIVSIAHMSNVTGIIHPVKKIVELARQVGAVVVVDGAQGAPHLMVDVQDLDCDFYAFSAHKCYGPTGLGVLYGKKALLDKMPPIFGGGDMIVKVGLEKSTYQEPSLRFEAGTPNIADVVAFGASIQFMQDLGLNWIQSHGKLLRCCLQSYLQDIPGLKILGSSLDKGPILSFTIENLHPLDVATLLDCEDVAIRSGHLCAQPAMECFNIQTAMRASFGVYNTEKEVEIFVQRLKKVIARLS